MNSTVPSISSPDAIYFNYTTLLIHYFFIESKYTIVYIYVCTVKSIVQGVHKSWIVLKGFGFGIKDHKMSLKS